MPALLLCSLAQAQPMQGFFMPAGFGYTYEVVKDNSLSPVSYSGHLAQAIIGFYYQDEKWLSQLDIRGMGGWQYPDVTPSDVSRQTLTGLGRAHYFLSYEVYENESWRFFAGLLSYNSWDYRSHNRYGNSQDNYTGLFSAGPKFVVQKQPFQLWQQNFALQYGLGLPVGTYFFRPGYVKPYTNNEIAAKDFAWWGDFFLADSRTDLIWILNNGNQLRLSYIWEYATLNAPNKVQLASHQLAVTTVFKF